MPVSSNHSISAAPSTSKIRRAVLLINGAFLTFVGGAFAIFDLLSYFWGSGPLEKMFYNIPYTVGLFEAHGLAFLMGLILLRAARWEPTARWHLLGAGIHLLLGTSNLLFWSFIVTMGVVTAEIATTALHWLFFVAQLICYVAARQKSEQPSR